jgi:hypothetical protein
MDQVFNSQAIAKEIKPENLLDSNSNSLAQTANNMIVND